MILTLSIFAVFFITFLFLLINWASKEAAQLTRNMSDDDLIEEVRLAYHD